MLGDSEAAADLAQDVCIALPAKLGSYRGESSYAEFDALEHALCADRASESSWLRQALGQLSEELRSTVVLVIEEGLRHAEAGEVLGVSEAIVSWRMHEVRKRLRALAANEEGVR